MTGAVRPISAETTQGLIEAKDLVLSFGETRACVAPASL